MKTPSVTLLGDGDAFGETVGDLLGVGFFTVGVGEGFFFIGVGVGLVVFDAPAASVPIPGNSAARTTRKILRENGAITEMVSNQNFTISRVLVSAPGFGTLRQSYGSSQKSFR